MSKNTIDPRTTILIIAILAAAAFRVPRQPSFIFTNLTPAGAMALLVGTYFRNRWKAMLIPVAASVDRDIFINRPADHWAFSIPARVWCMAPCLMAVIGFFISKVNLTAEPSPVWVAALLHWL